MVKSEQKQVRNDLGEQKQAIKYHEDNFEKVFKEVESAGIKEVKINYSFWYHEDTFPFRAVITN